jgi:hypothetical protein
LITYKFKCDEKIFGIIDVMAQSISMFMSGDTVGEFSRNRDISLLNINPAEAYSESQASSANVVYIISSGCRYDTTARECHLYQIIN